MNFCLALTTVIFMVYCNYKALSYDYQSFVLTGRLEKASHVLPMSQSNAAITCRWPTSLFKKAPKKLQYSGTSLVRKMCSLVCSIIHLNTIKPLFYLYILNTIIILLARGVYTSVITHSLTFRPI